ncbi:MAG: hypothetical protein JXA68_02095 [Ignavibacteriales bacterium]|nr:hypothetical protein [Ignavibacteriales bacterium]
MAKTQSFADKAKGKKKADFICVKVIKTMKSDKGTYSFKESIEKIPDISQVNTLK